MRKLRQDITLKEAKEWAAGSEYGLLWNEYALRLADIASMKNRGGYPDSFYEQPKEGSFGKFVTCTGRERWGFRGRISKDNSDITLYHDRDDDQFKAMVFRPGLPEDVDADGMPK